MEKIIGIVFAGMGVWFTVRGIVDFFYARESPRWPRVKGTVITSFVEEDTDSDNMTTYKAKVDYAYEVADRAFLGDQVHYGDDISVSSRKGADRIVSRFREGRVVAVFYDPDDPSEAVLIPGMHWKVFGVIVFGLVFFAVGVMALLGYIPMEGSQ